MNTTQNCFPTGRISTEILSLTEIECFKYLQPKFDRIKVPVIS